QFALTTQKLPEIRNNRPIPAARGGVCHAPFTLSKPNSGMLGRRRVALLRSGEGRLTATAASPKLLARPVTRLQGRVRAPRGNSESHRRLMRGALARGETTGGGRRG